MRDPYQVLGVSPKASQDEIKAAFRKLAKTLHPDVNPGAADRFKEVTAAYDLLSDPAQRKKFDRGDVDASGAERSSFWRAWAGRSRTRADDRRKAYESAAARGDVEEDDLFAEFLRAAGRRKDDSGAGNRAGRAGGGAGQGEDVSYTLRVPFLEAVAGITKRVQLSDGRQLDVRIPPGTEDGTTLRLKGQGRPPGRVGVEPGDAYVEVKVEPDPLYTVKGRDVHIDVPVTLQEAVLGGSITVPTVTGPVSVKVPAGSNTGSLLRLKGKGLPPAGEHAAGDQYVRLQVVLPERVDAELLRFVEKWGPKHGYDPRRKAGMS